MEDTEGHDASIETLDAQFTSVKTETSQSQVMEYGETDFKNLVIGDFEGDLDKTSTFFARLMNSAMKADAK